MQEITNQEKVQEIIEECRAVWGVGLGNYARLLIETHHKIGKLILKGQKYADKELILQQVAQVMKKSKRYVYDCVQFATKFVEIDDIYKTDQYKLEPYGKELTWRDIKTKYLPDSKKVIPEHEHQWELKCRICGKKKPS